VQAAYIFLLILSGYFYSSQLFIVLKFKTGLRKVFLIKPMKHFLLIFALMLGGVVAKAQGVAKADLSVYPNPTAEYISVRDNNDVVGYLAVYNIVGRKVKEFEYTKGDQYSLLDLPKGMYLVQIQDRNRQIITTQKVDKH